MKLYGTTTSPFVRRVRVVAAEIGAAIELVDTAGDAGQALLREVSPIRKVPVALVDGRTLFDSRVIIDWMVTTRGFGALAPPHDRWREQNLLNAIDAAVESAIQLFYLRRDGVPIDDSPFAVRQRERIATIFDWLTGELAADRRSFTDSGGATGLGLAEISLVAILDWMEFRATYPTERFGALQAVRDAWCDRPSLVATRPHT